MTVHRVRAAWAALTAVVLVVGGVVAPAMAEDPPPVWDAAPGYPIEVDDITVGFETTIRTMNPWSIPAPPAPAVPYIRPVIVNESGAPRYFGFGMDIAARGVPEHLWEPGPWGWIANDAPTIIEPFAVELADGQSFADTTAFIGLNDGVPQYAGRTFVIYALSGPPASSPSATQIASFTAAGRFVPGHFDEMTVQGVPAVGQPLEVTETGAASDVFPGVVATVEASGLQPGEQLDLWLIPSYDYFYLMMLGGALPVTAVRVGDGTVAADGILNTTIDVPATTPIGERYQLVAGVADERYWPAGSHRNFSITEPDDAQTEATPTNGDPLVLPFEVTDVSLTFPDGTGAGTTTAAVTATGPQPRGFQLASDPPLYYHFDTTSTWPVGATVEVCITYDEVAIPGSPPYLQHFDEDADQWVDITTTRVPGEVCGETSSFSAFTLGFPLHDGSTVAPAKGVLSSDNGNDTGLLDGDYTITMDLWSGENAGTVRLLEGGVVVSEQQLIRDTPNAQRALFPITGKANGTYVYTAELENSTGVTTTKSLTVRVKDANPGKPSLTATSPKNGAFTLTAKMSWGTNATSAQFYQGGVAVGAPIALTAQTPNAQSASLSLVRAKGDYVYKVAFTNAAGTTWSSDLKVKVK